MFINFRGCIYSFYSKESEGSMMRKLMFYVSIGKPEKAMGADIGDGVNCQIQGRHWRGYWCYHHWSKREGFSCSWMIS